MEDLFVHQYHGDLVSITVAEETVKATGNHPFWVVNGVDLKSRPISDDVPVEEQMDVSCGRWVNARDLKEGDELLLRRNTHCKIESVGASQTNDIVYNITVEKLHNYAVSTNGILVHNKAMQRKPGSLGKLKGTDALKAHNDMMRSAAKAANLTPDQQKIYHKLLHEIGEEMPYGDMLEYAKEVAGGNF